MRYLALWFAIVAAAGLWLLWQAGEFDGPATMWLFILFVGSLSGFALPNLLTRRNLSRGPTQGREARIEIGPNGVGSEVVGLSVNEWSWEAVQSAVLTPDGLMLYLSKKSFLWAPDHGFSSAAEMERAFELAERSGTQTRRAV